MVLNRDTVSACERQLDGLLEAAGRLAPENAARLAGLILNEAGVTPQTVAALLAELDPGDARALVGLGTDWLSGREGDSEHGRRRAARRQTRRPGPRTAGANGRPGRAAVGGSTPPPGTSPDTRSAEKP